MKRLCVLILIILICSFFLNAQDIDKQKYQECNLKESYENRRNNPSRIQYYKSMAHFDCFYDIVEYIQVVFYKDGSQFSSFDCYFNLPKIKESQVTIIYYHFITDENSGGFYAILDAIELADNYFVVGTNYKTIDNLRLRSTASISGDIIKTIKKDEWVMVLEENVVETIDDLTSSWIKVRLRDGTEGWCFGGYLGYR